MMTKLFVFWICVLDCFDNGHLSRRRRILTLDILELSMSKTFVFKKDSVSAKTKLEGNEILRSQNPSPFVSILALSSLQCDQMVKLFAQYLAICLIAKFNSSK